MQEYAKPTITSLGALHEMTMGSNKIGTDSDAFTATTGGEIVGTITPLS